MKQDLLSRLTEDLELPGEILPGQSLVELVGDSRVLVENHQGGTEYSRCRSGATVSFGRVLVCGENLELARMTQRQLVITGRVEGVTLMRRGRP